MTAEPISWPSTTEREATIHLNDTLSDATTPPGAPPLYDFDAYLTTQVRNEGHFGGDAKFAIGTWPATGNYGAVLLSELRQEQRRIYGIYESYGKGKLPDAQAIERSLDRMVVGVINWAVRRQEHRETGQNGDDFFIAELDDNIQIVSQLQYLGDVAGRGLIRALWRISDDNPLWPRGEQYRSSIASQLRNFPEGLQPESLDLLPQDSREALFLAYGDKYGNSRLGQPPAARAPKIVPGQTYQLRVDGRPVAEPVVGVTSLPEIPEDSLGVYINPADRDRPWQGRGVQYLELARRVADPNDPIHSAYEKLRSTVLPASVQHPDWSQVEIELAA